MTETPETWASVLEEVGEATSVTTELGSHTGIHMLGCEQKSLYDQISIRFWRRGGGNVSHAHKKTKQQK